MKLRNGIICISMGCSLILASCSPTYYPPQANVPLLQEKGDARVNASVNLRSVNAQGAYAVTDNFLMAASINAFVVNSTTVTVSGNSSEQGGSDGFQFDFTPGYYGSLGESGVFEVLGGYGIGTINSDDVAGVIHKLSIQPSIGFFSRKSEGGMTLRLTQLLIPGSSLENPSQGTLSNLFAEPIFTFRRGRGKVRFTTQIGISVPLGSNANEDNYIETQRFIFNMGVQYRFKANSAKN